MRETRDSNHGLLVGSLAARSLLTSCRVLIAAGALALALSACDDSFDSDGSHSVNGSLHVAAGKAASDVTTVNGSIHVDDNAAVLTAATVNGGIHLGTHATATSLKTVNGAISLGDGVHVSGSAGSVNGDLTLGDGADVSGSLGNVNGKIALTAAHVAGGISTVSGDIKIMGASHVEGGILVKRQSGFGFSFGEDIPRIVIGPGATVQGELHFERKVQLFVSDKATIGTVTGATPVPFTGDSPPS
jgi:cytoskeletal protein CcmA (bactofilin family)